MPVQDQNDDAYLVLSRWERLLQKLRQTRRCNHKLIGAGFFNRDIGAQQPRRDGRQVVARTAKGSTPRMCVAAYEVC